jgi:hypothetical protein
MHNLKTNFDKILNICKLHSYKLVDESGNVSRPGTKPKFSDLEVIALSMTSEALSIDSENLLFHKLHSDYKNDFPNLISRRQYNDRRKYCFALQKEVRERIAKAIDIDEDMYTVDSKPFQVCKVSRMNRCKVGKNNYQTAPDFGYCASQGVWYYGYKLHAVASINGVIHSFDMTKASVHDIKYLNDIKFDLSDCTLIGDKAYLNKEVQLDLFTTTNISLEVPMRTNQKNYKSQYYLFKRVRKRIETVFSQLDDQFMLIRNYAKNANGLFSRVLAKVSAMTVLQYINKLLTISLLEESSMHYYPNSANG